MSGFIRQQYELIYRQLLRILFLDGVHGGDGCHVHDLLHVTTTMQDMNRLVETC